MSKIKKSNYAISWIIFPNCREHKAPEGFDGLIPVIGTKLVIENQVYFIHEHVMYYDKGGNPILSIRARPASKFEDHFFKT